MLVSLSVQAFVKCYKSIIFMQLVYCTSLYERLKHLTNHFVDIHEMVFDYNIL